MKKFQILAVCLLFYWVSDTYANQKNDQDLILPEVIIKTSYQDKLKVPEIDHQFQVTPASFSGEPFLPTFSMQNIRPPFGFPQNRKLSNFAMSDGFENYQSVAGREGKFEYAIVLFTNGEYSRSKEIFQGLVNDKDEVSEISALYLGWVYVFERNWGQLKNVSIKLLKTKNDFVQKERVYLDSFAAFTQEDYQRSIQLIEEFQKSKGSHFIHFRHKMMVALSKAYLGKWVESERELTDLLKISWSPWYKDLLHLAVNVSYERRNLGLSLERFEKLIKLNPNLTRENKLIRRMSWIYYLNGNTGKGKEAVFRWKAGDQNEKKYLEMLFSIKEGDWKNAQLLYLNIPEVSKWKQFALVKLLKHARSSKDISWLGNNFLKKNFQKSGLGFYISHKLALNAFNRQDFKLAEAGLMNALVFEAEEEKLNSVRNNLAVTYLVQGKYQDAERIFLRLIKENHKNRNQYLYDLTFSYYRQQKWKELNDLFSFDSLKEKKLSPKQVEMLRMKSVSMAMLGDQQQYWKELTYQYSKECTLLIETAFQLSFQQGLYDRIINQQQSALSLKSNKLISFVVKSELAKGNFKKALRIIEDKSLEENSELLSLKIEVWKANAMYSKIVSQMGGLIAATDDDVKLTNYYVILGDSLYNEKKYLKSKNALYKALLLSRSKTQKIMIRYNLFLTNRQLKSYSTFTREGNLLLNDEITDRMRLNVTNAMGNYFIEGKKFASAEKLLRLYLDRSEFEKPTVNLRLIKVLTFQGKYKDCYNLAKRSLQSETSYQRRDRIISGGDCAMNIDEFAWIETTVKEERKSKEEYRKDELTILLAFSLHLQGKFKDAEKKWDEIDIKKQSEEIRLLIQFRKAETKAALKKEKEAISALGETDQYLDTQWYDRVLSLKVELQKGGNNPKQSVRDLYRLYYLPEKTLSEKASYLLDIVELYAEGKETEKARRVLQKIDIKSIQDDKKISGRFEELKKRLQ